MYLITLHVLQIFPWNLSWYKYELYMYKLKFVPVFSFKDLIFYQLKNMPHLSKRHLFKIKLYWTRRHLFEALP